MDAVFPGISSMLNLHPLFVHFPIAFWTGALIFEAWAVLRASDELHRTAVRLLCIGTVFGALAVLTGLRAEASVPDSGPAHEVMELHELLMKITLAAAMGLCLVAHFLRDKLVGARRKLFLLALVLLGGLLAVGADRGALMVYKYGVAVDWSTAAPQK